MPSLAFLNIPFPRILELVNELGRVIIALGWRAPPPEYTFRALEPVYRECILHFQGRVEGIWGEICGGEAKEAASAGVGVNGAGEGEDGMKKGRGEGEGEGDGQTQTQTQRWEELEGLLDRHGSCCIFRNSRVIPSCLVLLDCLLEQP